MRFSAVTKNILLWQVSENGEEADKVGLGIGAGNAGSADCFEVPVGPGTDLARVLEQPWHDIAADVANAGKRCELAGEAAAAAPDVDHEMVVLQTPGAQ